MAAFVGFPLLAWPKAPFTSWLSRSLCTKHAVERRHVMATRVGTTAILETPLCTPYKKRRLTPDLFAF